MMQKHCNTFRAKRHQLVDLSRLLPVVVAAVAVVPVSGAGPAPTLSDGLHLGLSDDGRLLLGLGLLAVGRGHKVARVLDDVAGRNAPLEHLGGKLVVIAEVREPNDVVLGLAVLDEHNCGDDFDAEKRLLYLR
jgi:hypothetical protein